MVNIDILKEKCILLPIEYVNGGCDNAIDDRLGKYIDVLKQYQVEDNIVKLVENFRSKISDVYREYYLGHQNEAYKIFKKALEEQTSQIGIVTSVLPKKSLYRARKNQGNQDYKNDEMFHIKYALRGKVRTQRYSFPGLPCLYLGGSSYVCWLELDRPQFDHFQVAVIEQVKKEIDYKAIDLCIHPLTFYKCINNKKDNSSREYEKMTLNQYLQWWPIMAVCSISVKNVEDTFKPEYIIPQFLLQYLLEEMELDCIGIKYMSIKAGKISKKQYEADCRTFTNYAIPIRSANENEKGFCEFLDNEYHVVSNFSGRELQVLTDSIRQSGVEFKYSEIENNKEDEILIGTNNVKYSYNNTIFGRIEIILENDDDDLTKYNDEGKLIISIAKEEDIKNMF